MEQRDPFCFYLQFVLKEEKITELQKLAFDLPHIVSAPQVNFFNTGAGNAVFLSWISKGDPIQDYVKVAWALWPLKDWITFPNPFPGNPSAFYTPTA